MIVPLQKNKIYYGAQCLFSIEENGRRGLVNQNGQLVVAPRYDEIRDCEEGMFAVCKHGKWGFVSQDGIEVIEPRYDYVGDFWGDKADVELDGLFALMDKAGKFIGDWGDSGGVRQLYRDRIGSKIREARNHNGLTYTYRLEACREGLIQAGEFNLHGYVDIEGQEKIPFDYERALEFSEGLAAVQVQNKWGYIDRNGVSVIPFAYDQAMSFSEGLAAIRENDKWGFIDRKGTVVVSVQYKSVQPFSGGYAIVLTDKVSILINRQGQPVLEVMDAVGNGAN